MALDGHCPQRALVLSSRSDGTRIGIRPECTRRYCPEHGTEIRRQQVEDWLRVVQDWKIVWRVEVPTAALNGLSKRLRRAGVTAWLRVYHEDETAVIFTRDRPRDGQRGPISELRFVPCKRTFAIRHALESPGITRKAESREIRRMIKSWHARFQSDSDSDWKLLAFANTDEKETAQDKMRELYEDDWPLDEHNPPGLTAERCDELFLDALADIRQGYNNRPLDQVLQELTARGDG